MAGILGLSPWSSPWSVWAEKTGLVEQEHSVEHSERMEIGKDAEGFLADVFNRHHETRNLICVPRQEELSNDRWPWLRGHADGAIGDGKATLIAPVAGWEAKTSADLKPWDEVPAYYQCQAQTYMMLSEHDRWLFTVGFAGWKVKHYEVLADREDQALIAKATGAFWTEHVLTGVAPDADGHEATSTAIRHAYNVADADDTLYADEELHALVTALRTVRADAKAIETHQAELENRIKARMADCGTLQYGAQVLATWRSQSSKRVDLDGLRAAHGDLVEQFTNTSTTRRFLVKTPKGQ